MTIREVEPNRLFKSKKNPRVLYRIIYDDETVETILIDRRKIKSKIVNFIEDDIFFYCDEFGKIIESKIQDTFPVIFK